MVGSRWFVFFFMQKTAYEVRISDWSSDVCSSDLADTGYQGLKVEEYIIAYGSKFPDLAGAAAEGASSWLYALPAEDGGAVPEQAAYLEWMAQTAPDAALDSLDRKSVV